MPFDITNGAPQRIAIVGGGISGLACAWVLSRHHHVTLYEEAIRLGGHARTVLAGKRGDQPVDTGFIVFNHVNYPHLTAMFRDLDVPIAKSDMSFGVSLDAGGVEYALRSGNALFGQRRNIVDPRFHLMIRDILRFNAGAEAEVAAAPEMTIAALIARMRLGARFRDHYLYPFCGAIWSTPDHDIGKFPARALVRFMRNHGLLTRGEHHQWWTVDGGSIRYVERLTAALRDQPGRKVVMIYVAGIDAMTPLAGAGLDRHGIELSTGGNILPALVAYKQVPGMEGAIYYYYEAPDNPVNDWLVEQHQERFGSPPDFFTAGGMASAMAIVAALENADEWDTESLIAAMEGMSFDTPKGEMTFRPEDHQALQSMYHFKIKVEDGVDWAVPELVREIKPEEMNIPVGRNNQE